MTENERNEAEWNNPENWHVKYLGIYYSKVDTRVIVPKRNPWMGATINFARPSAIFFLLAVLLIVMVPVVGTCASR